MTVKQLLVYVVIFLVGTIALYAGYTEYRTWQVANFVRTSDSMPDAKSLGEAYAYVQAAPAMVCTMTSSDFNKSTRGQLFIYNGRVRTDVVYLSENNSVLHTVYDADGLHIWKEGNLNSILVSKQQLLSQDVDPSLLSTKNCSVWWNPTDSVFAYPPIGTEN